MITVVYFYNIFIAPRWRVYPSTVTLPNPCTISHKWDNTMCSLLWLDCFISQNVLQTYPFWRMYQCFCFIYFYFQIIFYHLQRPYFVYLFFNWWTLGVSTFLSNINNAAMNTVYKFLSEFMFSFFLGVELLGHMITLFNFLSIYPTVLQSS